MHKVRSALNLGPSSLMKILESLEYDEKHLLITSL